MFKFTRKNGVMHLQVTLTIRMVFIYIVRIYFVN